MLCTLPLSLQPSTQLGLTSFLRKVFLKTESVCLAVHVSLSNFLFLDTKPWKSSEWQLNVANDINMIHNFQSLSKAVCVFQIYYFLFYKFFENFLQCILIIFQSLHFPDTLSIPFLFNLCTLLLFFKLSSSRTIDTVYIPLDMWPSLEHGQFTRG